MKEVHISRASLAEVLDGLLYFFFFFFFNDTATTEIYTLSLHDALPIYPVVALVNGGGRRQVEDRVGHGRVRNTRRDRKSTRLNSSHSQISYAVFCLKKKLTGSPPPRNRYLDSKILANHIGPATLLTRLP